MNKTRKLKQILRIIRLAFYTVFFIVFALIPTEAVSRHSICLYKNVTGNNCPTCGVTRAFSSIMHFKFIDAFNFNQVFTLVIFPISLIVILEDSINIIVTFIYTMKTLFLILCILFGYTSFISYILVVKVHIKRRFLILTLVTFILSVITFIIWNIFR